MLPVVSNLAEIEIAVEKLPPSQQDALYAFLTERIKSRSTMPDRQTAFATWIKTARGVGLPGVTTEAVMVQTRGEV